jgi:hypothetical protein
VTLIFNINNITGVLTMSSFDSVEAKLKAAEQLFITLGHTAEIAAAKAWQFVINNDKSLATVASIIATSTGNADAVPLIEAGVPALNAVNDAINAAHAVAQGHDNLATNLAVLADATSQLGNAITPLLQQGASTNPNVQQALNIVTQVTDTSSQVAQLAQNSTLLSGSGSK